jgi:hypothetical protein
VVVNVADQEVHLSDDDEKLEYTQEQISKMKEDA